MNRKDMRYVVKEGKGGKLTRFFVWDNEKQTLKRGLLSKENALGLEGMLNGKPHKEKVL